MKEEWRKKENEKEGNTWVKREGTKWRPSYLRTTLRRWRAIWSPRKTEEGRKEKRDREKNVRNLELDPETPFVVSLLSSLRRSRLNRHRLNVLETCLRTFTQWSNEEEQPTREGRTFEHSPFRLSPVVLWRLRSVQPPTTQSVRTLFLSGLKEETEREKGRGWEIEGAAGRLWSW